MRIVAGEHRGRTLVAPKGHSTRPTADRTRQAAFNVLEHAPWSAGLDGLRVIDLFAGVGGLGLEALSRGAVFCLFVDNAPVARDAIGANLATLGLSARAEVRSWDATRLPQAGTETAFDLAFLDAPYGAGLAEAALAALARGAWLAKGALVVVERGAGEADMAPPGYQVVHRRNWGAARVDFLKSNP